MRLRIALLIAAGCAVACGSTTVTSNTAWADGHPDPPGYHFAAAQGLCAITVHYPTEAPGEIDHANVAYVQRDRISAPASPGPDVGHSGDWTLHQQSDHVLLLTTPGGTYEYRDGANCGNNSAAPTGAR